MVYNEMSYYIEKRISHITKFLEEWELLPKKFSVTITQ